MIHLLKRQFKERFKLVYRVLSLVLPFGRRELCLVLVLVLLQGTIQSLGIFSIMPFLALTMNSDQVMASGIAQQIVQAFPAINADNVVLIAGITTVSLLILSGVVNGTTDYYRSRYAYFSGMRIGSYLLHSYANQPYVFHLKHNSAELIKRLQSEVNMFMSGVLIPCVDIFSQSVNVVFILCLLLLVNPLTCIIVLLVFGSLLSASFVIFRQSVVRGNIERKRLISERFLSANQLLTGIKTAMVYRSQDYFVKRFQRAYKRVADHDSFVIIASNGPRYTIESLAFSSMVVLVLVLHSRDQPLQGILPSLTFFVVASYRMLPALQGIYSQITKIQSQRFAVDVLYDDFRALRQEAVFKAGEASQRPLSFNKEIVFDRVTYCYPDTVRRSLQDVSFTISKGSKIGIVGSSGAGKSTLVDLLIGLLQPYAGTIKVDGVVLDSTNIGSWQSLLGYVSQDVFLLDDTLRNNIAFGISPDEIVEEQVMAAAQIAQIHSYVVNDMPEGYDTTCGERGVRLSGGQRQRIALARALYHQPSVLVFDEATSALDNETERNLVAAIEGLPDYFTTVTVAHRLSTVKNCDCILVFEKGRLVASDTYDRLMRDSLVFNQLAARR